MTKMLHYCTKCRKYTLSNENCAECNEKVKSTHPPKYSPQDKYQQYRIPYFKRKFGNGTIKIDKTSNSST